jgi:hypothetical protein
LLPDGQTITTIEILNVIEHASILAACQGQARPFPYLKHQRILNAHNCAQNYLHNARKNPHNARKRPQIPETGKFV